VSASLAGRVAVVTGAGRGIGRAIAVELARADARTILVARSADQLADAARAVGAAGGTALTLVADLAHPDEVRRVIDAVASEGPTILIGNAATIAPLGATASIAAGDVQTALALNVAAPILLTGGLLPAMVAEGWGRIVNVSSGIVARPAGMIGGGVYAATKAALEAHTINLAAELAGTGVTVNAYRPGMVDTAMQGWIREQDPDRVGRALHERFVGAQRDGLLITPEHSAAALVARLDSDETGAIWDVADAAPAV
jgi:NAD(P)-dependent dehydrogenase (short-subunit alcohol dehydrogenase family)